MDNDYQAQEAYASLHDREAYDQDYAAFQDDVMNGILDKEGMPLKCRKCGSNHFKECVTDRIDSQVMEFIESCGVCGEFAATWNTGNYMVPTP